jgi:hypothetical protein
MSFYNTGPMDSRGGQPLQLPFWKHATVDPSREGGPLIQAVLTYQRSSSPQCENAKPVSKAPDLLEIGRLIDDGTEPASHQQSETR